MKSLKNLVKKLNFRTIFHVVLFSIVCVGFIILGDVINDNEIRNNSEREQIINRYESIIKEKDSLNAILVIQQKDLESKLDSFETRKNNVIIKYDEKIKIIYDASAAEHAEWMGTIIAKLRDLQRE